MCAESIRYSLVLDASVTIAFFLVFCDISSGVLRDKASVGQYERHLGSPSHRSQTIMVFLAECKAIAPNSHVSMHHAQPLHFSSSTMIMPVSSSLERAFLGQDLTHVGSSHKRQAMDMLKAGSIRKVRIRDSKGLNPPSFTAEQMYSQI